MFILGVESGHQSLADLQPKTLLGLIRDAIECGLLDAVVKEAETVRGRYMGGVGRIRRRPPIIDGDDERLARAGRQRLQRLGQRSPGGNCQLPNLEGAAKACRRRQKCPGVLLQRFQPLVQKVENVRRDAFLLNAWKIPVPFATAMVIGDEAGVAEVRQELRQKERIAAALPMQDLRPGRWPDWSTT